MRRIRAGADRVRSAIAWPFRAGRRWWDGFDSPEGQIATVGLVALGVALAGGVSIWAGIGVPAVILIAISMGFDLRRRGS